MLTFITWLLLAFMSTIAASLGRGFGNQNRIATRRGWPAMAFITACFQYAALITAVIGGTALHAILILPWLALIFHSLIPAALFISAAFGGIALLVGLLMGILGTAFIAFGGKSLMFSDKQPNGQKFSTYYWGYVNYLNPFPGNPTAEKICAVLAHLTMVLGAIFITVGIMHLSRSGGNPNLREGNDDSGSGHDGRSGGRGPRMLPDGGANTGQTTNLAEEWEKLRRAQR